MFTPTGAVTPSPQSEVRVSVAFTIRSIRLLNSCSSLVIARCLFVQFELVLVEQKANGEVHTAPQAKFGRTHGPHISNWELRIGGDMEGFTSS